MADKGTLIFQRSATGDGTLRLGDWGPPKPRLQNGLLFRRKADGSGKLVFGYTVNPGTPHTPDADLSLEAVFADDMRASIGLSWDANVSRYDGRAELAAHYQHAALVAAANAPRWQITVSRHTGVQQRQQDARALRAAAGPHWQQALALRGALQHHHQPAAARRAAARMHWQESEHLRAAIAHLYQDAVLARTGAVAHWQEMLRLRHAIRVWWQPGAPGRMGVHSAFQPGLPERIGIRHHWQEARRPLPGHYSPPAPEKCYDPARLGLLVFRQRAGTAQHGTLYFICTRRQSGPEPGATIVVERRRSYIVINAIEVRRVDTDQLLPALDQGLSMQLDRGSWTWGFTVTFHASALPLLQPAADGTPVALTLTVNGQPFRMVVESIARSARFPSAQLTVRGRGRAALLDAPYAATRSFSHDVDRTAQQLMEDALTINGVSIGWSLDWQIDDWYIPAATWAHQGTWITAVTDIAAAVGAYVQPHDTGEVLRILPAWPAPIWELAAATPDIELPPGIATVEETEWITRPDYDALYLHGEPGTSLYYRNRAGTAGDSLAPMAVHSLLVHADAARQRALAELSETGRQVEHQLQLMVLPETGIIKPGTLLRYTDDAAVTRTGITRAVSVAMSGPTLTQTVRVQAHA